MARLQTTIQELHRCKASHRRTVIVHEEIENKIIWDGAVEVFWLSGHPGAKRCFAWSYKEGGPGGEEKVVVMLENARIIGPATAVRSALAARAKKKR